MKAPAQPRRRTARLSVPLRTLDRYIRGLSRRPRQGHNASVAKVLHRVGWIGLTLIAAFLLFAVANDLRADHSTGLPVDHTGAFTAVAGQSFDAVRQST